MDKVLHTMLTNYANIYYKNSYFNCYFLIALTFIIKEVNSVPSELTFIINKQNASHIVPICIGEGEVLNSAIAWIYPLVDSPKDLPRIDSNYLPISNNEYNCNFGKSKSCSSKWETDKWKVSEFDMHSFKPILDSRWENFPTYLTSNLTEEFNVRLDIPNVFEIGISIRAAKNAEIFLCEGWSPQRHACYYINIGGPDNKQSLLRKYKNGIPDKFSKNDTKLAKYKHEVGVLSDEDWKTFSLSLDTNGTIKLNECTDNVTIINYNDKNPLKPINVIVRSKNEKALWKIHKNEYIFTTKKNMSKFGPELQLYGSRLCISLHVSICKYCGLRFFAFFNGEKKILNDIAKDNGSDELLWEELKLIHSNIFNNSVQIYVETYFTKKVERENGFWAIDDIRMCWENEIRMTKLVLDNVTDKDFEKSHITCEVLKNPMWRPIHVVASNPSTNLIYNSTSTSTSIKLFWNSSEDTYPQYSVVQYEGNHICKNDGVSNEELINTQRMKSQGYLIGKGNHVDIQNLVPYTSYNITFWNVIDDDTMNYIEMYTLATEIPTKEEIPRVIKMTIYDTINKIEWKEPKCTVQYGPLFYQIYVKNQNGNDTKHYLDILTKYNFENLLPFTNYTIEIETARKLENFNKTKSYIKTIHNFTTKAGIAPKVNNIELYCTNDKSASIRFDLPSNCKGLPTVVQVRWCHPLILSGCVSEQHNLTKCKLWDSKYCVEVNNLIKGNEYKFNLSIKNRDTFIFGEEESIKGKAIERVPGKPSNLTYHIIKGKKGGSPCNLNISWDHPYEQNGTITMFDVILEETSYDLAADTLRTIREILKIDERSYQKRYSYIVNYLSYGTPYKISVRAVNDIYKGDFEFLNMKTDNVETYTDQTPEFINSTNETITFKLPPVDQDLSMLIVVVQDYDNSKTHILDDIVKLEMFHSKYKLCNDFGDTWVAKTLMLSGGEESLLVIGDHTTSYIPHLQKNILNKPLDSDTEYCFTFAFINQHDNTDRIDVYHYKHVYTQRNNIAQAQDDIKDKSGNVAVYVVPILCIFLLLVGCGVWFFRRYFIKKRRDGEHIYESMPFDDCIPDAVSNDSYDKLVHT